MSMSAPDERVPMPVAAAGRRPLDSLAHLRPRFEPARSGGEGPRFPGGVAKQRSAMEKPRTENRRPGAGTAA